MKNQKYSISDLQNFVTTLFEKIGCTNERASITAEILIKAELRGINSHGLIRIKDYYELYKIGRLNPNPNITIEHETPSTAVVNGDNGLGPVVAYCAMQIAIKKAKDIGTAWVSVNNSNHFGIAGYYSMMALEQDMIGISMTNSNPLVAPTYSIDKLLGTNPIAIAIPAGKQDAFIADFATTPIARGKLAVMHKLGKSASDGYVQDKDGFPSNDPNILTKGGAILPLGGDREHGSHKGYCLGSIVDIFSSILSGANFGPFVPPQISYLKVKDNLPGKGLGHFFGAMRIDAFQKTDDFKSYMDMWLETFRNAKPVEGQEKVLVPGDPERKQEIINNKEGIQIIDFVKKDLRKISEDLDMQFID